MMQAARTAIRVHPFAFASLELLSSEAVFVVFLLSVSFNATGAVVAIGLGASEVWSVD
jgi:hypothetical protein